MTNQCDRRSFLKAGLLTAAGLGLGGWGGAWLKSANAAGPETVKHGMATRALGRTGWKTPLFSLGGQATIEQPGQTEKAHEIIKRALDLGINYIDTAPAYGRGVSESYIGEAIKGRRDQVFLATKSHDYSYDGTMRLVEQSLQRLQTDRIDLYQHHNVGSDRQLQTILAENGALRAFRRLREEKVVEHLGITSHSSRILLQALERDEYECMLITLNPAGAHMNDRNHLDAFMTKAEEKEIGVIAMKLVSRGRLLQGDMEMEKLIRYSLSFPVATAVIGITDVWQVDEDVKLARQFKPLSGEARQKLEQDFS